MAPHLSPLLRVRGRGSKRLAHVLNGVVDQVLKYLADTRALAFERRQMSFDDERDAAGLKIAFKGIDDIAKKVVQTPVDHAMAGVFDFGDFQKLGDQTRLHLDVLLNSLQTMNDFIVEGVAVFV